MNLKELKEKLNNEKEDLLMYCPIPRTSSISTTQFICNSDKIFTYRDYLSENCWFQPYNSNPPKNRPGDDINDWDLINFISDEQSFFINTLTEIKNSFCENIFNHENKMIFSIVRNPIDRLFSIWNYCTNSYTKFSFFSLTKEDNKYKIKDFNKFVKNFYENGLPEKYPQKMFLKMSDILNIDLYEKIKIYKFEELEKYIDFLKLNYNIECDYPYYNYSNKNIIKNITKETCEIISNLYKEDFERFDYDHTKYSP